MTPGVGCQTGLQLSEITALRRLGFVQGRGARVGSEGKGRKERGAPLTKSTVAILTEWIQEQGRMSARTYFHTAAAAGSAPTPSSTWSQSTS